MNLPYVNGWDSKEAMIKDWEGVYSGDALRFELVNKYLHVEVLLASYVTPAYSGSAFVLFRDTRDNKLYENHGSHCSCMGLEDQWEPEAVDLESLKHRVTNGQLGEEYDDELGFAKELMFVIQQIEAGINPTRQMIRWIRIPGPGEMRGEGTWKDFDEVWPDHDDHWVDLQNTKYLPTKELPKGEAP